MSGVVSKNLFDLLGNDPEEAPQLPVQPVDKTAPRHGKRAEPTPRDAAGAPTGARGGRGGRRGDNATGSERAFQDRDAGRGANRGRPTDDNVRSDRHSNTLGGGREQRGRGRGRGGRGGLRGDAAALDRRSRTGVTDSDKQASKGWGDETGAGEWRDEVAGEAQAAEERKDGVTNEFDNTPAENGEPAQPEPEPEKQKTLADWQAEQEEKRRALGGNLAARQANEGTGKKQPEGKALEHDDAADFFTGSGGKKQRERERKERSNQLVLEHDYATRDNASTGGTRGGRGGRGGRGRGEGLRGQRGDRARGGRGGAVRGARGGVAPNIGDTGAFPSLGA